MPTKHVHPSGSLSPGSPAWSDDTLRDLHARADKASRVRSMFAAIAGSYDLNNRVHSLWLDQAWRRATVRAAGVKPGEAVLDVACGTGDLTHAFARRSPAARVVGLDFTREMLDLAGAKRARLSEDVADRVEYLEGDAQDLPFEDGSFDVLSIAFGIRNVQEPPRALAAFFRVLRPGGRLLILEFDRPRFAPARWLNDFYAGWLMPRTATLISGDRSGAYRYLPESVRRFTSRAELVGAVEGAGFVEVTAKPMSAGIVTLYRALRR